LWKIIKEPTEAFFRALSYYPTNLNGQKFKCDPYHVGWWRRASKNQWEPYTLKILSQFLTKDSTFCDIGAWIGPTSIYAAKQCKRVFSFEPDWVAYQYLLWNIRINNLNNVLPFNIALANEDILRPMSSFSEGPNGDSTTTLLKQTKQGSGISAMCMSWETWSRVCQPGKIDFMKIDIEGGEYSLLPTMKDYFIKNKPVVYLSTHAPYLDTTLRMNEMKKIREVMSIYSRVLSEDLKAINFEDLIGHDALNSFKSYIFLE
jgi:FkbM family methyltransferase